MAKFCCDEIFIRTQLKSPRGDMTPIVPSSTVWIVEGWGLFA